MKTVYVLRCRFTDQDAWLDPVYYRKRKERDNDASASRIIGGFRTHSYEEKKTQEEIDELVDG